jgi:voltage-gated potassium channel
VFQKLCWVVYPVCAVRVFEIVINQLSVLFQTDKESGFEPMDASDPRRLLAVALSNYIEIIVWYALLYRQLLATEFKCNDVSPASPVGALYFSLVTTTTVGYGDITPNTEFAAALVSSHLVVGILLTLLVLARFVGALVLGSNAEKSNQSQA